MTPQYVSFKTFSGSRHSIVRLFLSNYISLRMVFLVLDAHICNIQKTPLYSWSVILHSPSSLHHHHSLNIFLWLLYFDQNVQMLLLKYLWLTYIILVRVFCVITQCISIFHKLKKDGFWKIRNCIKAMNERLNQI